MSRKVKIKPRSKQDDSQTSENIDAHTSAVIDLADSYHDFLEPGLFVRARSNIIPDHQEKEDPHRFRIQPGRCRMLGSNFLHKKNYILDNIPQAWTEFLNNQNLRKNFPQLYAATLHDVWDWKAMSKKFGASKDYENWIVSLMNSGNALKSKEYRDIPLSSEIVKNYLYSHTDKTKGNKKLQNMAMVDYLQSYDILRNTDLKLIEHTSSLWDAANKPKGAEFVPLRELVRPPGETGKYVFFSDTHVHLHNPVTEKTWTIPLNQLKTLRISVRSLCTLMDAYENKKDTPRTPRNFVTTMIKETLTCEKSSFLNHTAKTQKKSVKKTKVSSPGEALVGFLLKNSETETKEKKRKTTSTAPVTKTSLNIPRVLDIKRSGDYGQVAFIKKLYDQNFTKMVGNNKESFIRHYLLTADRLCYLRAKLENTPAILVKNTGTINIYPGDLVDTIQYKKYIEERQKEIWEKRTQVAHLYKLYQNGQLFDPRLTSYYKAQNFQTLYDTFVDPINQFSQVRDIIKSAVTVYPEAESFLGIFDDLVQIIQHVQQTLIQVISDIFAFFSRREDIMREFVPEIDNIIGEQVTSLKQVQALSPKDTEEIHERLSQVLTYLEFITRTFRISIQTETIYTTPEKIDFIRINTPVISTQANAFFITPVNKKKTQTHQDDDQVSLRVLRDLGLDNLRNLFRVPVQYIPTSFEQITMERPFCQDDITHPTSLADEIQKILTTMFSFFPNANASTSSSLRRQRVLPRLTVINLQQSRLLLEKKAQTMLNTLMDKVDDHAFLIFHSPFQENDARVRRNILDDDMGVEQTGSSGSARLSTSAHQAAYYQKSGAFATARQSKTVTKRGEYYLSPQFREGIFHDFVMAWTAVDENQKVILSDWTCFVCVLTLMHDVMSNAWDVDGTVSYDEIHGFFYTRVQNMMKDIIKDQDAQVKNTLNDPAYGKKKKLRDIKKDILQIPFIKKDGALREFWTFMLDTLYM